jgi:hypothetical protein
VEENQPAVDERPKVGRPADARLVLGDLAVPGEAHLRGRGLLRDREEMVEPREVDDLAVIGRRLPGHATPLSQRPRRRNGPVKSRTDPTVPLGARALDG